MAITDSYVTVIKHIYTREMLEIEKWITDQSIVAEITLPCLPGMREGPGQGAHSAANSQHNDSIMEFLKMQSKPTWTNRISHSKILWIQHSWLHFYTLTSVRYPVTIVSSTGSLICNPFNPSVHWAYTLLHFVPERW